jgi:hypothetical protein
MASRECRRFEDAIASGSRPDDALSEHASNCPHCRALADIAALRILPVPAGDEDPALPSIYAAAAQVAACNADRWQRRRRTIPVVIGLAGYLIAASAALVVFHRGIVPHGIPGWFLGAMQVAFPAPTLWEIGIAFAASAVWTAVVALLARNHRQATHATAGNE